MSSTGSAAGATRSLTAAEADALRNEPDAYAVKRQLARVQVPSGNQDPDPGLCTDDGIRRRVLGGFAWSAFSVGVAQVTQIVVGVILVRLLSPHDYGLAGMALLFSSLVLMLSDVSMGAALVQRKQITEADRSTVFWTSAIIGTSLTLIGLAMSGPLADFFGQPEVQPLFAVVSLSFVLVALQTTQHSIMQREMRFKLINIRVAAGVVVGGATGIVAGILGAGPWALVLQQVSTAAAGTAFLWAASSWRPHFIFSRRSLRDLGGYGVNLLGSQVLTYAKNYGDNLLVGRFLGSAALGAYAIAYNLMFLPVGRLIVPIQETMFPALSRWQDDLPRLGGVWLRLLRMVSAVLAPAMFGFVVVAPDFVSVILGQKWHSATPVLQILAIVALAQCLAQLGLRVLGAVDRTRLVFRFCIVDAALSIGAFALGLQWGIVGVAWCYLIVSVPLQVVFVALTARVVEVSMLRVVSSVAGVALATATMAVGCLLARVALTATGAGPAVRLGAVVAAGIGIYAVGCVLLEREVVREIRNVRRRRGGKALAVAA
jgi:O-antigen/teichoic acid export membrane protein